jgi:hypothetical protein
MDVQHAGACVEDGDFVWAMIGEVQGHDFTTYIVPPRVEGGRELAISIGSGRVLIEELVDDPKTMLIAGIRFMRDRGWFCQVIQGDAWVPELHDLGGLL